jgi:hypothetical protein
VGDADGKSLGAAVGRDDADVGEGVSSVPGGRVVETATPPPGTDRKPKKRAPARSAALAASTTRTVTKRDIRGMSRS